MKSQMHGYLSIEEINRQEVINKRCKIQFSLITFLVLFWTAVGVQPDFLALPAKFYHWGGAIMIIPTYVITFGVLSTLTGMVKRFVLSKIFKTCFSVVALLGVIIYWVGVYHHYYTGIGFLCILFGIFVTIFAVLLSGQIIDGDLNFPDIDAYFKNVNTNGCSNYKKNLIEEEEIQQSPLYKNEPSNLYYGS